MVTPLRRVVAAVVAVSVALFLLQVVVVRPRLWPAGAGLTLSGDAFTASLAEPSGMSFATLPDMRVATDRPVTITAIWPGGPADVAGLKPGAVVTALVDPAGRRIDLGTAAVTDGAAALRTWRDLWRLSPVGPVTLEVLGQPGAAPRAVRLDRPAVWDLDRQTMTVWLREFHLGPIAKHLVYTASALLVVALGARGVVARLMTLAFLLIGMADSGPLVGGERYASVLAPLLLAANWTVMAAAFPVIGLAVLHFPTPAPLLERHPWVIWAMWLVAVPLLAIGGLAATFLAGWADVSPALASLAGRPWIFTTTFAVGLAVNVGLVFEGVNRFRRNPDIGERRRIQSVVATAVPGVLAYTLATGVPMLGSLVGVRFRWAWGWTLLFQFTTLLSALGLAYAVAVNRALSPRTVIRAGLRYALARKTLALLTTLPGLLLLLALYNQRDRPLAAIVQGQPLFYLGWLAVVSLGLRYRDRARRWLDRRFFRAEYDAREILLGLASRVPNEHDPRALVSLVLGDIETALHPESVAMLADDGRGVFAPVQARGASPDSLPAEGGLVQLLRWSEAPLEVFLDDPRASAARLPATDRAWLGQSGAALLVPIFAGTDDDRPLVGVIVLGPKRSEEPFSGEDRQLLAGIAGQMGLAADLSRLRRLAGSTPRGTPGGSHAAPTIATPVQAVVEGGTVEGKYRIDALIGRGGMGAVYRARDLRLDRDVALKVVRGELVSSPSARERFQREARLAARLQHPSIATIYDFGVLADGSAYLVMEYVRGGDLRGRLASGPLDVTTAVRLMRGVAGAVEAAHRQQVLHRDLKPENVLLPEGGASPKVVDFGVAKAMSDGQDVGTATAAGTVVGTPAYMAPEQLRGEVVDARADVYSLAVMTFEMLTGRLPYGAGTFVDVALRQSAGAPVVDTTGVPPAVGAVLTRALSSARSERPASAAAFAAELEQAAG